MPRFHDQRVRVGTSDPEHTLSLIRCNCMKTALLSLIVLTMFTAFSQDAGNEFYDTKYDPTADPVQQLEQAKQIAAAGEKRILLDVGGEWCVWCHRLDDLFRTESDVAAYLKDHYVPVKINYSLENKNEKFLSQFPPIEGYPHIFVLDAAGKLLHSQNTGDLEEGKGHSREKVMTFLKAWAEGKQPI